MDDSLMVMMMTMVMVAGCMDDSGYEPLMSAYVISLGQTTEH